MSGTRAAPNHLDLFTTFLPDQNILMSKVALALVACDLVLRSRPGTLGRCSNMFHLVSVLRVSSVEGTASRLPTWPATGIWLCASGFGGSKDQKHLGLGGGLDVLGRKSMDPPLAIAFLLGNLVFVG